jgi:hypothetical protein
MAKRIRATRLHRAAERCRLPAPTALRPIYQTDTSCLPTLHERPTATLLFGVLDEYCAPLLRSGDIAVIDLLNRAIAIGQLFLLQFSSGRTGIFRMDHAPPSLSIIDDDERPFMIGPAKHDPKYLRLSDGPLTRANLDRLIIGRVIGVLDLTR